MIEPAEINISIVIPCHPPHIKYLDNTFQDILKQTVLPLEVILAISGINIDLAKTLENKFTELFKDTSCKFKIVHTDKKQYAGTNRNMGGNIANGQYIMFIDADDILHPRKVEITTHYLNLYNPNILLHGYVKNARPDFLKTCIFDYDHVKVTPNDIIYRDTFGNPPKKSKKIWHLTINPKNIFTIAHGYATVKKTIFNKYKYTNVSYGEDSLFVREILWKYGGVIHINIPLIIYLQKRG